MTTMRFDELYDNLESDAELDQDWNAIEQCVVCSEEFDERAGEVCINCGGWVCDACWNGHKVRCLKR